MLHTLKGKIKTRSVWLDGCYLYPKIGQKIINHSPDGFNWGYEGSGPAQLALSVILKLTGEIKGYQEFKRNIISVLPQNEDFDIEFLEETGQYFITKINKKEEQVQ